MLTTCYYLLHGWEIWNDEISRLRNYIITISEDCLWWIFKDMLKMCLKHLAAAISLFLLLSIISVYRSISISQIWPCYQEAGLILGCHSFPETQNPNSLFPYCVCIALSMCYIYFRVFGKCFLLPPNPIIHFSPKNTNPSFSWAE